MVLPDGGQQFLEVAQTQPSEIQARAMRLYDWAKSLEAAKTAVLWTHQAPGYTTLIPRAIGHDAGLVTLVTHGSMWTWPSVFIKKAPATIERVENALGGPLKHGGSVKDPSESVLAAVAAAYSEASARVHDAGELLAPQVTPEQTSDVDQAIR